MAMIKRFATLKKIFDREELETIVTIIALVWLSILCVFVKYDWREISEALLSVWH